MSLEPSRSHLIAAMENKAIRYRSLIRIFHFIVNLRHKGPFKGLKQMVNFFY